MKNTTRVLTGLAVGVLTLAVAAPAYAEGNGTAVTAANQMRFQVGGKA